MTLSNEAIQYLECFSKFEYALIMSGFHTECGGCKTCGKKGFLCSDWDRFKTEFLSRVTIEDLKKIHEDAEYLIASPPRKRAIESNQLIWKDVPVHSVSDIIDACRRVRNNLAHGNKHAYKNEETDQHRNKRLLSGSTQILEHIVKYCGSVQEFYYDASYA